MALVLKNLPVNAGDTILIRGLGRSLRGGNGALLQYSCLENPMGRGAWQATVCGVTKVLDTAERLSVHTRVAQGTLLNTL